MKPLRVAVVGVGYLGRFHAEKYAALDSTNLVGVCDLDGERGRELAGRLGTNYFASHRALIGQVDAVIVAASTAAHYELTHDFLERDVHVLVEKPISETSREAAELSALAEQRGLKLQVGHIERFNPALVSARDRLDDVRFIECHRLAPFTARGVDVNVVLDLMIHDLDVILSLVDSEPQQVSAIGIAVLTDDVDIANARIEFENDAIANVTASRVSTSSQRKFRVFQQNQYLAIDFGAGEVLRVNTSVEQRGEPTTLQEETWNLDKGDALLAESTAFVDSIVNDTPCVVSGRDGQRALELAETIINDIEKRRPGGRGFA